MEERSTSDWFSKPGDSIRAVMQRRGIDPHNLADLFDEGMTRVRALLDGSASIREDDAIKLSSALGANPTFWLTRQENFDAAVSRAVERIRESEEGDLVLSIPAPGAKPRGKLTEERKAEEIRRRLVYFNIPTVSTWETRYGRVVRDTDFRKSATYSSRDCQSAL